MNRFRTFWARHGTALLTICSIILASHWPLLVNLRTHIVGRSFDDAFEVIWQLEWMKTAVFTQQNPFFAPNIFYPNGWYTASGAQPGWYFLLLAPVTNLLGGVTTYNLLMLGCLLGATVGAYLLAWRVCHNRLAALIAALAYSASPILTVHMGGHTHTFISMAMLPFTTLAFLHVFEQKQWRWWELAGTAVLLALTILGLWYFLFIATIPLVGFALMLPRQSWRDWLTRLAIIGTVTLLLIAPAAWLTWQARQQMFPSSGDFSMASSDNLGVSPDYLLAPNALHPLWGDWSRTQFPINGEQSVITAGFVVLGLAVVGLFTAKWRQTRPFLTLAFISLILAMGLTLHWGGSRVLLDAPPRLAALMQQLYSGIPLPPEQIAVPLPGLFLYRFVPFYASMRVWARFMIPFMLGLSMLAGLGATFLLERNGRSILLAALLGGLVLFEGWLVPYQEFTAVAVNERTVDQWLAAQPEKSAVIEYPRPIADKLAMYREAAHQQPVVNGYMSIEPTHLAAVSDQLGEWPSAAALSVLREWGVRYVLVNGASWSQPFHQEILPQIEAIPELCLVRRFDDSFMTFDEVYLFELLPAEQQCSPQ